MSKVSLRRLLSKLTAIALSTSALCVYTVDKQLSSEYEANSRAIAQTIANSSTDIILNRDLSTLQSVIVLVPKQSNQPKQ